MRFVSPAVPLFEADVNLHLPARSPFSFEQWTILLVDSVADPPCFSRIDSLLDERPAEAQIRPLDDSDGLQWAKVPHRSDYTNSIFGTSEPEPRHERR